MKAGDAKRRALCPAGAGKFLSRSRRKIPEFDGYGHSCGVVP